MLARAAMLGAVCLMSAEANTPDSIDIRGPPGASSGSFAQLKTFSYNDIKVFRGLNGGKAQMQNFPPHYLPGHYQITSPDNHRLPKGSQVSYHCAPGGGPCEAVVFVYECAPCKALTGGLHGYLVLNGYERTRCTPTFTTGVMGGAHHKFTGFAKSIPEGSDEVITLPNDAEFVVFGLSNGNRPPCADLDTDVKCEDGSQGRCEWKSLLAQGKGPQCHLAKCISRGPSGGCQKCVYDELALLD